MSRRRRPSNAARIAGYRTAAVIAAAAALACRPAAATTYFQIDQSQGTSPATLASGFAGTFDEVDIATTTTGTLTENAGESLTANSLFAIGNNAGTTGTFVLNGGSATSAGPFLVGNKGTAVLNQSGGQLSGDVVDVGASYDNGTAGNGRYTLTQGSLNARNLTVGDAGVGLFNQGGGTVTVSGTPATSGYDPGLQLGFVLGSSGTYLMAGGTLNATTGISLGVSSTGRFNQTGGSVNAGTGLSLGTSVAGVGTYLLTGGSLTTPILNIGTSNYGQGTFTLSGSGSLTVTGSSLNVGGRYLSNGTFNLNGGTISTPLVYVGYFGAGTLNQTAGTLQPNAGNNPGLIVGFGSAAPGTYNLSGGTVATYQTIVGDANGTFAQTGGTHNASNGLIIGYNHGYAGTYTLGQAAGATSLLQTSVTEVALDGTGTFVQTAGTHAAASGIIVGDNADATGTYNLSGGTVTAGGVEVGDAGAGTYLQSGGTATVNNQFHLGTTSSGTGTATVTGGTLTANQADVGYNGTGSFYQSAGTVSLTAGNGGPAVLFVGLNAGSHGLYQMTGGTLTSQQITVGYSGTGTFNQSGGTVNLSGSNAGLYVGVNAGSAGTLVLAGGKLQANNIMGGSGTSTVDFNGGTFQSNFGNVSEFAGITAVNVQAGGGTIDASNYGVTVAVPIAHDPTPGAPAVDGGLTFIDGAFTFTGTAGNTYTGLTDLQAEVTLDRVTAGGAGVPVFAGPVSIGRLPSPYDSFINHLYLAADNQLSPAADLTVHQDGAVLLQNHSTAVGSLTMTGGQVTIGTGNLTLNGDLTVVPAGSGATLAATIAAADGTVHLTLGRATGGNGRYNLNVSHGSATYDLTINSGISGGSAGGALTKIGNGTVLLTGTANPGLSVNIAAGTLALGSDTALGSTAGISTWTGGTLTPDGGDRTIPNPITLGGNTTALGNSLDGTPHRLTFTGNVALSAGSTLDFENAGGPTTFSGPVALGSNGLTLTGSQAGTLSGVLSGTGGVTATATGTVTLSGADTYTGGTTVAPGGALTVGGNGSLAPTGTVSVAGGVIYPDPIVPVPTPVFSQLTFAANPGTGLLARTVGTLAVGNNAFVTVANPSAPASRTVLVAAGLGVSLTGGTALIPGDLDLGGNDLVVHGGRLPAVTALAAVGYAGGAWNGLGLTSSAAAADARRADGRRRHPERYYARRVDARYTTTFAGQPVTAADVLARYTYYGDANLDGVGRRPRLRPDRRRVQQPVDLRPR